MHVKDVLDDLGIRVKLPQHWFSTDVGVEFEEPKLIENDEIIKIEAQSGNNRKVIVIDVDDGMSVVTVFPDNKVIGVKYLNNKDDFEYIGKPSELYF
jgi:vacuolar-type H+-ATPase subunit B/Vma2